MPNYLGNAEHTFEILSDGDERFEVWLDGKRLMGFNHDEHGWSGIEAAIDLTKAIAESLSAKVKEGEIYD